MVAQQLPRIALSPDEAAEALGVTPPTIFALIRTGELKSAKLGRRRLIAMAEIDALLVDGRESRTR